MVMFLYIRLVSITQNQTKPERPGHLQVVIFPSRNLTELEQPPGLHSMEPNLELTS